MIKPISVRGHHLYAIGLEVSLEDYGEWLVLNNYVTSREHPFVAKTYEFLRQLRENPDTQILVVDRQPDFICINCPPEKRKRDCKDIPRNNQLHGTTFWDPKILDSDVKKAGEAGLKVRGLYTVGEIIKATREQTAPIEEVIRNLA